jgi:hypothetical protein
MRGTLRILLLAFLAVPLFAADDVFFDPPRATPQTAVTLEIRSSWSDGCIPMNPQIARSGNSISVTFSIDPQQGCILAVSPWNADVFLGLLDAGGYDVAVNVIGQDGITTMVFRELLVVFEENRMRVTPTMIPSTGGTDLTIGLDAQTVCPTPDTCKELVFAIDDVRLEPSNLICCFFAYSVTAPPHAPGVARLTVRDNTTGTVLASAILQYFDASQTESELFERVLIPIIFSGPGAHGAQWVTDVTLLNRNAYSIGSANRTVGAFSTVDLSSENRPAGWVINVLREAADQVHFGLLVRDLSRQAEALGTEIPVVREKQFRRSEFFLMNVPIDTRSRQTLRIYGIDVENARAELDITPMSGSGRNIHTFVDLEADTACTPHGCTKVSPAFASLELSSSFPELIGAGPYRVRLIVTSGFRQVPAWAFVSVANNTTQHVTAVTPQ